MEFANFLFFPHQGSDHFLILIREHRYHSDLTGANLVVFRGLFIENCECDLVSTLFRFDFRKKRNFEHLLPRRSFVALMFYFSLEASAIEVELHPGIHLLLPSASDQLALLDSQDAEAMVTLGFAFVRSRLRLFMLGELNNDRKSIIETIKSELIER